MDTNINIPKKEIAPGIFSTGGTATMPSVNPINNQPNVITPQSLVPQPAIQLPTTPVPTVPQPVVNFATDAILRAKEQEQKLLETQNSEQTSTQKLFEDIIGNQFSNTQNLAGEAKAKAEATQVAQPILQDIQNIDSQIKQKEAELVQIENNAFVGYLQEEKRDTLLPFAQMGQNKILADKEILKARKYSEIAILNAQVQAKTGQAQLAIDTANAAVEAKYAPFREQNAIYEAQLKAIEPLLTREEKKQATTQKIKLDLAMREIEKVSDFQKQILSNAISSNAPQSVINAISKGQSVEEISKAGAGYLKSRADILEENLKIAQTASANRANQPSKEKSTSWQTINGVPTLMDNQTGKPINEAIANPKNVEESKANFQFLMDTAKKAQDLSTASGKGQYKRDFNEKVFGASSRTVQLDNLANTLRTNMLILNTDPNVKKFFGPQMSNNDVKLMMAGGTTLDPASQTPEAFKAEATRIYDLVDRANKAVDAGIKADPTEAYYQQSSEVVTKTESPKGSFLQEYNSRKK